MKFDLTVYNNKLNQISRDVARDVTLIVQEYGDIGECENDEPPHLIVSVPEDFVSTLEESPVVKWHDRYGELHAANVADVKCYSKQDNLTYPDIVVVVTETDPDTDEYIELDFEYDLDIVSKVNVYELLVKFALCDGNDPDE